MSDNGKAEPGEISSMLAVEAIAAALEPYEPRVALGGLVTALATWIVENNIDPSRIIQALITGIQIAETAKDSQDTAAPQ